jgi:hypothetical protein
MYKRSHPYTSVLYKLEMSWWTGEIYVKVELSLFTPRRLIGWVDIWLHLFLTLVLDEGEWSFSRSDRLTPGNESRYPLNRRLRGPQGLFGVQEKRKVCSERAVKLSKL